MGNQSASLTQNHSIIALVGFMGAGKTSVGKELARLLRCSFEDLDDRVEAREGRTIEEIFRDFGEDEFRRCERQAVEEMLSEAAMGPKVISLGGGAFVQKEISSLLQQENITSVFLDAPVDELYRRCQHQAFNRPLRKDESSFRELHELRRPRYLQSTHRVETSGKPVSQVAREIAQAVGMIPSQ